MTGAKVFGKKKGMPPSKQLVKLTRRILAVGRVKGKGKQRKKMAMRMMTRNSSVKKLNTKLTK